MTKELHAADEIITSTKLSYDVGCVETILTNDEHFTVLVQCMHNNIQHESYRKS